MGAPETGSEGAGGGGWITVQPGLPATFTDITSTIQGVLQALIAILNILLAVLQIVKAFITGLLNPLQAIIDAIIEEIEGFLNDLREIGIYVAGDTDLDPPEFASLIGGFSAYERRMVARLVNRSDPTRPKFSSRSAVIAIFLYVSADTTGLGALASTIQRILAFFGRRVPIRTTTVAVGLTVTYGEDGASLGAFGSMTQAIRAGGVPNQANIRWLMAPSSQPTGFLQPAPKGFLVEVSTLPDGLLLAYDTYPKNALVGAEAGKRVYGLVRDPKTGLPFRLYGGADIIDVADLNDPSFSKDEDGTNRVTKLYAYQNSADNVPIPVDALKDGKDHILQRAFFVKGGFLSTNKPGSGFSVTLDAEDMPFEADFKVSGDSVTVTKLKRATTVYVRVSQVTKDFVEQLETQGTTETGPLQREFSLYGISSGTIISDTQGPKGNVVMEMPTVGPADKGEPSLPLVVTFPAASTADYMEALTAALCVLVLARADLPVANEDEDFSVGYAKTETGLEEISRFLIPNLIKEGKQSYFERDGVAPEDFRKGLLRRARQLSNHMYQQTGPLGELESTVVEAGEALLSFKWSNENLLFPALTILESLDSSDAAVGVGLNPFSLGLGARTNDAIYSNGNTSLTRAPGFMEKADVPTSAWVAGQGSADKSPVIYFAGSVVGTSPGVPAIGFCRNILTAEVYEAAASILNIAASVMTLAPSPDNGAWTTFRLFPQGLPPVEAALDEIIKWIKAISAGIQGFADIIVSYIEFLQARLLELQALIVRINALLGSLTGFALPAVSGLVVTANGTDGILQGLITADNKPFDSSTSVTVTTTKEEQIYGTYGAGVVLLAGGLPTFIIEILQAIFPEAE